MSRKECVKGKPFRDDPEIPGNFTCSRCDSVSEKKKHLCKPEEIKAKKKKKKKKNKD